ncbi:MAG: NAD(P)-binding protein, partial [Sphingobacteriaceae bacterium]|nr:NAD(P)-binding protein [Cytophagaceae bacterium]
MEVVETPPDGKSTVIIGAGPAGLSVAGRLRQLNQEFVLLEKSDRVAAAWHGHYDRLHLHTV